MILQDLTKIEQDLAMILPKILRDLAVILQYLTKIQQDLAMTPQDFTKFVARTHGRYRMKRLYMKYTILWV
jgi:hypothetical protein